MKILLILAHPDPACFNHAVADAARQTLLELGHDVIFHDLILEEFDPVLPSSEIPEQASLPPVVAQYCEELASAEGLIFVHLNWWGQPPAVLKGWIDRVFRPGIAYRFEEGDSGEGIPVGLLKARCALVFNTSNTPPTREQAIFGDPLEGLWTKCILELCGVRDIRRRTFATVVDSSSEQRRGWLQEVRVMTAAAFF